MAKLTVKKETKEARKAKVAAKKMNAKKVETKKVEVKEEVKKEIKPIVKTTTKTVKSTAIQVIYQFAGRETTEKALITAVKEMWTGQGNKIKDIQSLNIYIKPEEKVAYYVINDTEKGKIDL